MCDGDGGAALLGPLQRLLHHLLALRVQGGRRLVQQQDGRVPTSELQVHEILERGRIRGSRSADPYL